MGSGKRGGLTKAEADDIVLAHQATYTPPWLSAVLVTVFYGFLLVRYQLTDRVLGLDTGRFVWVLACIPLLFATICLCNILFGIYLGPILFHMCTGLRYRQNRMAYARAGGYDSDHLTTVLTQAAVFGLYWWTAEWAADPAPFLRNIWSYTLVTVVLAVALNAGLDYFLFRRYARHSGIVFRFSLRSFKTILYYTLGSIQGSLGRCQGAIAAFQEALRLDPDHLPSRNGLADIYYNIALRLARAGEFGQAESFNRQSIQLNPDDAVAHNNLGVCLYALRRHDEAVAAYREALRLDPNYAPAHNNLGEVLVDLRRHEDAIAECREAIRLDPSLAEPHYHIGRVYWEQRCWADVVREWEEALRKDPSCAAAANRIATAREQLERGRSRVE